MTQKTHDNPNLRITILVDNGATSGLRPEPGFSLWVESDNHKILFDTGQGEVLLTNSSSLGVDLASADAIVLSHGHYDHTGGLPLVLRRASGPPVFCHPGIFVDRYSIRDRLARAIGIPDASRHLLQSVLNMTHLVEQPELVAPGMGLTGEIPRLTDYEDVGGPFYLDEHGVAKDPIRDDMALWLRTAQGLVICVGCAHAGIVNTVEQVRRIAGDARVRAIIGGFHLAEATEMRMDQTVAYLRDLAPEIIVPCHCTGSRAVEILRDNLGECVQPGKAGLSYNFAETRVGE